MSNPTPLPSDPWPTRTNSLRTGRPAEPLDTNRSLLITSIAAGCDVVTVQRALGHAKATTTLNTYAHLWPTAEDRTRRAAGDLLAEVLPILADRVRTNERS